MLPDISQFPKAMRALELIADGRTVRRACDEVKIGLNTFQRIIRDVPEFRDLYAEAEQRGYDNLAEILLNIDTDATYGSSDTKQQKIISDNIKWFLSRKRPSQYGDKVEITHVLTADKAIIGALERGRLRAIGKPEDIIDGTFKEVVPVLSEDEDWAQFI